MTTSSWRESLALPTRSGGAHGRWSNAFLSLAGSTGGWMRSLEKPSKSAASGAMLHSRSIAIAMQVHLQMQSKCTHNYNHPHNHLIILKGMELVRAGRLHDTAQPAMAEFI